MLDPLLAVRAAPLATSLGEGGSAAILSRLLVSDASKMAYGYEGAYVVKGRKKRYKAWPMILSLVFGCVSCVVLGVAIIIAVVVITVALAPQSTLQYYAENDTRLASLPLFFCQNVSLDVSENDIAPQANFEATMYVLDYLPPMSATKNPLTFSGLQSIPSRHTYRYVAYILSQSTICVSGCIPGYTYNFYNVHIISGVANIDSFSKNPTTDSSYSLGHKRVVELCTDGYSYFTYNVSGADDYYAVVAVPERSVLITVNITVTFNRKEYSLDQVMNGSYPNCTSTTLTDPCNLPVPLGSNVLVVAGQPQNWDNNSYTPVTVSCANTRPSSFVLISVVPLVCVFLVICLAGVCGSFIAPHYSCKSKIKHEGAENAPLVPYVPKDD